MTEKFEAKVWGATRHRSLNVASETPFDLDRRVGDVTLSCGGPDVCD